MSPLLAIDAGGIKQSGSLRVSLYACESARLSVGLFFIYSPAASVEVF